MGLCLEVGPLRRELRLNEVLRERPHFGRPGSSQTEKTHQERGSRQKRPPARQGQRPRLEPAPRSPGPPASETAPETCSGLPASGTITATPADTLDPQTGSSYFSGMSQGQRQDEEDTHQSHLPPQISENPGLSSGAHPGDATSPCPGSAPSRPTKSTNTENQGSRGGCGDTSGDSWDKLRVGPYLPKIPNNKTRSTILEDGMYEYRQDQRPKSPPSAHNG